VIGIDCIDNHKSNYYTTDIMTMTVLGGLWWERPYKRVTFGGRGLIRGGLLYLYCEVFILFVIKASKLGCMAPDKKKVRLIT
jgi:hypothetical protein